jgi:hypothetical protein
LWLESFESEVIAPSSCQDVGSITASAEDGKQGGGLIVRLGLVFDSHQRKVEGFRSRQLERLTELVELVVIEDPRLAEQEMLLALQFGLAALDDRESLGA